MNDGDDYMKLINRVIYMNEIKELAAIMCDVLDNYQNDEVILKCRERVKALCKRFPVYKD